MCVFVCIWLLAPCLEMFSGGPSLSPKAPIVASRQCPPCWRSAQNVPSAEHANLPPGSRKVLGPRQRSGRVPNLSSQSPLPCQATAYHSSSSPAGLLSLRMASAPSDWSLTLLCFISCSPWPLHGWKPEEDLGLPFWLQGPRCPPKKASKDFEGTEREPESRLGLCLPWGPCTEMELSSDCNYTAAHQDRQL